MADRDKNSPVVLVKDRVIDQKQLEANTLIAYDNKSQYITFEIPADQIEGFDLNNLTNIFCYIYFVKDGYPYYTEITTDNKTLVEENQTIKAIHLKWLVDNKFTEPSINGKAPELAIVICSNPFNEDATIEDKKDIVVWQTKSTTKTICTGLFNYFTNPNTTELENPWTESILQYLQWKELTE